MDPVGESTVKTRTLTFGHRYRQSSIFRNLGLSRDRRASTISESIVGRDGDADSDEEIDVMESPVQEMHRQSSSKDWHKDLRDPSEVYPNELADSRILGNPSEYSHGMDPKFLDLFNEGLLLKKRCISVYVSLCGLKSFVQLNRTAFSKAIKKYDKILDRSLRRHYMNSTVSEAYPFTKVGMEQLDENIVKIEKLYADFVTKGDIGLAKRELRLHLREHVVWERNTVWREMIGIERKAQAAGMGIRRPLLGGDQDPETARRQGDELEIKTKELVTPVCRCPVPEWLLTSTFATLVAIVVIFCITLGIPIMSQPEEQNCLAMLVFVSLLWSTEVTTLFLVSHSVSDRRRRLSRSLSHQCLSRSSWLFSASCAQRIVLIVG
jgi:phosphate transporter